MPRAVLLLLLFLASACGGSEPPATDPAEDVPPVVDPPTPPPAGDVSGLMPQEPLPEGESTPAPAKVEPPTPAAPASKPANAPDIRFDQVVTAAGVADRKPTGVSDSFADGVEVFCFMKVTNPGPPRALRHEWWHGDTRKSSIKLTVKGPTWRTWSSRPIYGTGAWRVDVVDEEGTVLTSVPFTVR